MGQRQARIAACLSSHASSVTELLFLLAVAPSALLAYTVAPSATVLNQLLSLAGWGLVCLLVPRIAVRPQGNRHRPTGLQLALGVYGLCGFGALALAVAPASMALSTLACTLAAIAVVALGAQHGWTDPDRTAQAFFLSMAFVGCANVLIALLQVFAPELLVDKIAGVIARSGLEGRAVGNLRQPNHLSSIALWSAVSLVPLAERRPAARWALAAIFALVIFSVELSASRTGMVGVGLLALWGLVDRRLSRFSRALLVCAPVVYAIGWAGMTVWATDTHHTFGAAARLGESDISGSRYGIWSNTWALIRQYPWTGVGFGEFNFAWTLTPFPGRPVAFFDHTHNVVLELLVELGVPLGLLVVGLLGLALWQAFRRAFAVDGDVGIGARAAFVMVLLMAVHSQLEYPLWYAYFLLPTAWAWGYCLGVGPALASDAPTREPSSMLRGFFLAAGALMIAGAAWAWHEYFVVAEVFEPSEKDTRSLQERIDAGRKTVFFAHHADYAAATVADHPSSAWESFRVAPHYLLDTRLMIAWATALEERGDRDRASYIAARLREFRKDDAAEFFAPCAQQPLPSPPPFQCVEPSRPVDWHEFRDPAWFR